MGRVKARTAEPVDRIRLTILDPPSRTPLIEDAAKVRTGETQVDLRAAPFDEQIRPLTGAVDRLAADQRLRVRLRSLSPATLAALQLTGERFQVIRNEPGDVELLVWRGYTKEQRRSYLRQAVDGR